MDAKNFQLRFNGTTFFDIDKEKYIIDNGGDESLVEF